MHRYQFECLFSLTLLSGESIDKIEMSEAEKRKVGGGGRYRSPHHRMLFNSRNEGSKRASMTWRVNSACPRSPRHRMPFNSGNEGSKRNACR